MTVAVACKGASAHLTPFPSYSKSFGCLQPDTWTHPTLPHSPPLSPPPPPPPEQQNKPFRVKEPSAGSFDSRLFEMLQRCDDANGCVSMWSGPGIFSGPRGGTRKNGRMSERDKVGEGGGLLQEEREPSLYRHSDARWLLLINIQP